MPHFPFYSGIRPQIFLVTHLNGQIWNIRCPDTLEIEKGDTLTQEFPSLLIHQAC